MALTDGQVDVAGRVVGQGTDVRVLVLEHARGDVTTGDTRAPGGGVRFGVDEPGGATVNLELQVEGPPARVWDAVDGLHDTWAGEGVRSRAGAVVALTVKRPGAASRRVYGRPRRFTPTVTRRASVGLVPVVADFQCVDDRWYADVEDEAVLGLALDPTGGGLTFPVTWPAAFGASETVRQGAVTVGGSAPTGAVRVTFRGPVVDPWVDVDGGLWRVALTGAVAYDEEVVVDASPWARSVTRAGAGVPGMLHRATPPLSTITLAPGGHDLRFGGVDPTATARATVAWRPSWRAP